MRMLAMPCQQVNNHNVKTKVKNKKSGKAGFFYCTNKPICSTIFTMKNIGTSFLLALFIMQLGTNCFADNTCGTDTCKDGQYCNEYKSPTNGTVTFRCEACDPKYANSSPETTDNFQTIGQSACFKYAQTQEIENGHKIPTGEECRIYYNKEDTCTYTIECDNTSDLCNGYHPDGKQCVKNQQSCTINELNSLNASKGVKIWENGKWSSCYATECKNDYHGENEQQFTCNGTYYYKDCAVNRGTCEDKTFYNDCPGKVTGEFSWANQYRFDNCKCEMEDKDITNGKAKLICSVIKKPGAILNSADNFMWDMNNCETAVTSCDEGFCEQNKACLAAPIGTYSGAGETSCNECPNASTTMHVGSTNITDCAYKRGNDGTKFCDKYGCFYLQTLPGTDGTDNKARQYIMYKN